ncbi:uncharacterized protein FIBRA_03495 [Fibroporia radiculosa]|uniref:F-box domain-containing protein n=1 Tax=Fibroporia radiculosa TaxID=599839 RepID=J4G5N9_9APHY|nr:uncharacterized protein FIBRA_03495 [Fibroporia radiculosa]CCM01443.1 predicted protein [Fibroporia radiculosa]
MSRIFLSPSKHDWEDTLDCDTFAPEAAFPYSMANVCTTWMNAMFVVSEFWTRIIILIDEKSPAPLAAARLALSLAPAQAPLDIHICRKSYHHDERDSSEAACVAAVLEVFKPEIGRWHNLSVDVLHGTSLPFPSHDLTGNAPELLRLLLRSSDGIRGPVRRTLNKDTPLLVPSLRELCVDGYIYHDAYLDIMGTELLAWLRVLQVSRYAPSPDVPTFSVRDLWESVRGWTELKMRLVDLALDCADTGYVAFVRSLTLEQMPTDVIGALLQDGVYCQCLRLGRCALPLGGINLAYARTLVLEDIDGAENLRSAFGATSNAGSHEMNVTFRRCPSLDDAFLEMLSVPRDGRWVCPSMIALAIYDCPNFSDGALRRMIDCRRKAHKESGFADKYDRWFVVHSIVEFSTDRGVELGYSDLSD